MEPPAFSQEGLGERSGSPPLPGAGKGKLQLPKLLIPLHRPSTSESCFLTGEEQVMCNQEKSCFSHLLPLNWQSETSCFILTS